MEKQQEILFKIVSESKLNSQQNIYSPLSVNQIDPSFNLAAEQRLWGSNMSAFTPSKPIAIQRPIVQMMPNTNLFMNTSKGFPADVYSENTTSLSHLLSEIYKIGANKQL